MNPLRSRIAPTPSGLLHIGNVYSFVLTWLIVRKNSGRLLLRIDDVDGSRVRLEYLEDIFETLRFLGIDYDEGPQDTTDFLDHFSQHYRLPQYEALLGKLKDTGLVYACTCSRKDLMDGKYDGACKDKNLPLDTVDAAWRIHTPPGTVINFRDEQMGEIQIDLHASMPDFVIRKKDGLPAYQVVSLADDLLYNINCIVRGEDLLHSTAAQLWLTKLTANNAFINSRFYHHPLIKDENGLKLSKSAGPVSIKVLRENGMTGSDVLNMIKDWPGIEADNPVRHIKDLI